VNFQRMIGFAALLALAVVYPVSRAQAPADSGVIRTETKLVLVDTVVTDKKGNYVRDLTAKEFKVYEDGKEQTIKSFSSESDPASGASQKRYLVLLFDNSTLGFGDQARARQAAAKFIESNGGPNRMMAIANFGGALQISQNFTDDTERLKNVVNGIKFSAVAPNASDANSPQLSTAMASFGARDVLYALKDLAKGLSSVPGRKTLILITAGFPLTPEIMSEATSVISACNKANVAIYPIDVRGLMAPTPVASLRPLNAGARFVTVAY
jgi:VWFA-related protein